jgi:hypothetical protein
MNRYEFEKAVFESQLDAQAKQVLLYMAHRKNWERDTKAWPSTSTIALHTGLSPSTVKRRLAILRAGEWLVASGDTKGRGVVVYDLHVGHPDPVGVQPDTEEGHSEPTGVSAGPTEEVHEQVKEDDQEEVMTGALAPVEDCPFEAKEEGNSSSSNEEDLPWFAPAFLREFDRSLCGDEDPAGVDEARAIIRRGEVEWPTMGPTHWRTSAVWKVKELAGLVEAW